MYLPTVKQNSQKADNTPCWSGHSGKEKIYIFKGNPALFLAPLFCLQKVPEVKKIANMF